MLTPHSLPEKHQTGCMDGRICCMPFKPLGLVCGNLTEGDFRLWNRGGLTHTLLAGDTAH